MRNRPINDLNKCSVNGCDGQTAVIVSKKIGEDKIMFGYCEFHSIVSATFFPHTNSRVEIRV